LNEERRTKNVVLFVSLVIVLVASFASAQVRGERFSAPAPDDLASPIKSLLAADGVKVAAGAATLEFWWVSALPLSGGAPAAWSQVAEGTLVGALRVNGPFKDIRGKVVKPGVYTLRFGLQPQNGDHLGASPFREHLLLSPAAVDTDPKALGFEGTVALSKQTIGASHPAALSLDPPVATMTPLSAHTTELDHKALIFQVRTASGGTLTFGLVLIGVIEH